MDQMITKTEAKAHYGATAGDLASLKPEKTYFSMLKRCEVTLYAPSALEAHLQADTAVWRIVGGWRKLAAPRREQAISKERLDGRR